MTRETEAMMTIADGLETISSFPMSDGLRRRVRQVMLELRQDAVCQNTVVQLFADRRAS